MKRFLVKIVAYLLILMAIIEILNFGFWYNDPQGINKYKSIPDNIQICNLGASHSMCAFNYVDYEDKFVCFNFGLSSQQLSYDLRILNYYKEHLVKGAVVYIVVTFPMILGPEDYESEAFLSLNDRYYRILPPEYVVGYELKRDIEVNYAAPIYFGNLKDSCKGLLSAMRCDKVEYNSKWNNTANMIDMNADAKAAYERHIEGKASKGETIDENKVETIYLLIETCKKIGVIPILVSTPVSNEYLKRIEEGSPEYIIQFEETMKTICSKTGVKWYDYTYDERFKSYKVLENADHLNKEGARLFTDILIEETLKNNK